MSKSRGRVGATPPGRAPTHLLATAGDRHALCGLRDAYPHVLVRWAPDHGYPDRRCRTCYELAGLSAMLTPEDT